MASFGQDTQTELPPSQSFLKNPFSIRNILNLSEEPQDRCAQNTSNQRFPIVPQVVRPLEFGRYTNVEVGLACYRTTQRLSALRNFPPWLLGTRFMRFLPGKWMKTKRCYLVHVHLRNFYTRRVDVSFQPRLKGFLPLCHLRYLLLRWNLRKKRKKIPQELWFMEYEQDPTLMEEKLIEGGGGVHTYANVTAMASSLNGLNCLTSYLGWFFKTFFKRFFFFLGMKLYFTLWRPKSYLMCKTIISFWKYNFWLILR